MTFSNLHPPPSSSILRTIVLRNVYVLHPLAVHHFFSPSHFFILLSPSSLSTIFLSSSFSTFHSFFYLLEEFSSLTKNVCVLSTHFFLSKKSVRRSWVSSYTKERLIFQSPSDAFLPSSSLSFHNSVHVIFQWNRLKWMRERKKKGEKAWEKEGRRKRKKDTLMIRRCSSPLPLILHSDLLLKKKKISSFYSLFFLFSLSHWLFLSLPLLDHQIVWLNWASFSGNCFTNWPPLWRRDWTFLSSSSLFSPSSSLVLSLSLFLSRSFSFILSRSSSSFILSSCLEMMTIVCSHVYAFSLSFLSLFLSLFLPLSLSFYSLVPPWETNVTSSKTSLTLHLPFPLFLDPSVHFSSSLFLPSSLSHFLLFLPLLFILSSLSIFILSWEESLFLTLWTFITCFVTCIETGSCNTLGRWGPPPPFSSES